MSWSFGALKEHLSQNANLLNRLFNAPYGLAIWLAAYMALWTIVPILSNAGFPADTMEIIAWAREWPMGVYRHPPVKIWLMEIAYQASGGWKGSAYILSALGYAVFQVSIYLTIRTVYSHQIAFTAVIVSPLIFYFSSSLPQWNANTAQFAFIGLFAFFGWKALQTQKLYWWIGVGLAASFGLQTKYSFVLVMAALFLAAMTSPTLRPKISWIGVALAAVIFVLIAVPHAFWLTENFDIIFAYITNRVGAFPVAFGFIVGPLAVVGAWLAIALLPYLAVRNGLNGSSYESLDTTQYELKWLVAWLAMFPSLVGLFIAGFSGAVLKDEWFFMNYLFLPALLVVYLCGRMGNTMVWTKSGQYLIFGFIALMAVLYPGERVLKSALQDNLQPWTPVMPTEKVTLRAQDVWRNGLINFGFNPEMPIKLVSGEIPAATVANHLPGRTAKWFEEHNFDYSPWVTPEELRQFGAVHLGNYDDEFWQSHNLCAASQVEIRRFNGFDKFVGTLQITAILPIIEGQEDLCINQS